MNIILLLICLSYIFGGIGYITTIKHLDDSKLKDNKLLIFITFIGWPFWLIMLGFAATMTEFEFWIKKQIG